MLYGFPPLSCLMFAFNILDMVGVSFRAKPSISHKLAKPPCFLTSICSRIRLVSSTDSILAILLIHGVKIKLPKGLDFASPSGKLNGMEIGSWLKAQKGRSIALSRLINVPPSFVTKMAKKEKEVPAEHCRAIVDFTDGAVTVQELRPNDWFKYWQELAVPPVDGAGAAIENVVKEVNNV